MLVSRLSAGRQLVLNVFQSLALGLYDDRQGEVDAEETGGGEDGVVEVDAGPLCDKEVHLVAEEGGEGDEGGGEAGGEAARTGREQFPLDSVGDAAQADGEGGAVQDEAEQRDPADGEGVVGGVGVQVEPEAEHGVGEGAAGAGDDQQWSPASLQQPINITNLRQR